MNLFFSIDYKTTFGQELVLHLAEDVASGLPASAFRMKTTDGVTWRYDLVLSHESLPAVIHYHYSVENGGVEERREWKGCVHRLVVPFPFRENVWCHDRWTDWPEDTYLYSTAFTECVNKHEQTTSTCREHPKTLRLVVRAPQLPGCYTPAVAGDAPVLGGWQVEHAVPMVQHGVNEWQVEVDADALSGHEVEFKIVALSSRKGDAPLWETGLNRRLKLPRMKDGDVVRHELSQAFFDIPNVKLAGTLVPVFSLRTEGSFGVGDFGDLLTMIDFMALTRQRVLQVLPINDTTTTHTWTDSYPYSAISIFALHPQFVDLRQLPALADAAKRKEYAALQKELNALPQIDYERVNNAKATYMHLLFEQEWNKVRRSENFVKFFKEAAVWLVPYARYCFLRDTTGSCRFADWKGEETWDESRRKALENPSTKAYKEVAYYYYVQYVLFRQMEHAHSYARSKGVVLKGDIPIGVDRNGCDVWVEPHYFNLDGQAGAPPDDFAVEGQNWGLPTYNWDAMLKDGCRWWVNRFRYMARFFDAYRIDHVLGFFRIWEIPDHAVHGLLGHFSPALGLTREEISAYGLPFLEEHYTTPFISDWIIDRVFPGRSPLVKEHFLDHAHDDIWHLKPDFDTQRKIETYFAQAEPGTWGTEEETIALRDGLYALAANVLFLRDHRNPNLFHPRISAQFGFTYEALWDKDKEAFNRLYNDYFYRRNNHFWYVEAMKKLPRLVEATGMLVCAEDLGMVPDCVAWVMNELRILSLEVQSMPKDPTVRFGHLERNPYRSVAIISSHDMPTLRQWWDEDGGRTQRYYNTMLYRGGAAPHPLPGWLARDVVQRHLQSPSMLCVLSIQDWLAIDEDVRLEDANAERINVPSNPRHYWRYRMHKSIEELMKNQALVANLRDLVEQSGRNG